MGKKKVFITGICGFVASNLANRLVKLGYEVSGCDDLSFGFPRNVDPEVKWLNCGFEDISDLTLSKYDVLAHLACANIIYAINNPINTFNTNSLKSIFETEKFKGQIVFTSTSSVYGNAHEIPTNENSIFKVTNAYDKSKLIFERYLRIRGNYTTLRLSNVYGRNQRPENPYCGVIGKFIDAALKEEPIEVYGDGLSTRDFTYIDDVVNALILAIDQDSKNTEINIGTGMECSIIKLANIISDSIDKKLNVEFTVPRTIDKITRRCLNIKKAKELLGWKPNIDLKKGIKLTIKNFEQWDK